MAHHWTLKQLRLVALAAASGSYAKAAQDMGLSPPAVTAQMKALEEDLGVPVFERADGRLRPTAAGKELLAAQQRIANALVEAERAIAALKSPEAGSVVVGVVSTAKYFAPMALAAFRKRRPEIELKLMIGNREDIIGGLVSLDLDLAVMGRPPPDLEAQTQVIGDHPHVIIAPPAHRLIGCRLDPADLAKEPFLVREPGSGTRILMERVFGEAGVPQPPIAMEIGSNETIKQAVMAGLGLSFISAHTVAAEVADGRLEVLDVAGLPAVRQWLVVRARDKRLLPAGLALQDFLAREGGSFLPKMPAGEGGRCFLPPPSPASSGGSAGPKRRR
ncbi:LysR family transcriptional regulator [Xanthobacter dioxanivorans]|uniref:HTH-type transcriptional regulator CbbR n=1 Tax=Xanthobacter dioxanivorans TaxID=2528964 RepID=A0A974PQV0_9HYPH|nr:LysR family transcriptional regulator [Xanthobacter dioxanivorans]QRG08084.1 LysR family transcriptional regulator [Xanthobacter dioxanivorans]